MLKLVTSKKEISLRSIPVGETHRYFLPTLLKVKFPDLTLTAWYFIFWKWQKVLTVEIKANDRNESPERTGGQEGDNRPG